MSKRYYLCPIIGDGTERSPYRAKVHDYRVNHSAVFPPQDPATGLYARNVCLVLVNTRDHRALLDDAEIHACPDVLLDAKLDRATLDAFEAGCQSRGLSAERFAIEDDYATILRDVGRQLDGNFNERTLNVSE